MNGKRMFFLSLATGALGVAAASCGPANSTSTTLPGEADFRGIVENFIKTDATFVFDGVQGSIKFIKSDPGSTSSFRSFDYTYQYQTAHPGHGDRTGKVLAQVITDHNALLVVDTHKGKVIGAVCDQDWDMVNDRNLQQTVKGTVLSGGDTTQPNGPVDAPRVFVYQVRTAENTVVNVSYTAYPPSPAGDAARAKITLDFRGGQVTVGDTLEASGRMDPHTGNLIVAEQGDYIRTSAPQP